MTKPEYEQRARMESNLAHEGFEPAEIATLRRASMTLHRWYEMECGTDNGCVERDEVTCKTYWHNSITGRRNPIPDRETGARARIAAVMGARNARFAPANPRARRLTKCVVYIQTDPRECALLILTPYHITRHIASRRDDLRRALNRLANAEPHGAITPATAQIEVNNARKQLRDARALRDVDTYASNGIAVY